MNKNEKFVITINREVGSGGRTVGRKLAERLAVKYYDKALVEGLTEKYGLSVAEIERLKAKDKTWWDEFNDFYRSFMSKVALTNSDADAKPTTVEMFETERHILEQLASRESCVVAGRSAFLVFRDWPNHVHVFIQASTAYRMNRIMNRQGVSMQHAIDIIDELDNRRETYMKQFTDRSRYDTRNYQLVISMDNLTEDAAVDIIMAYLNNLA